MSQARVTLAIDSATADEAHAFIAGFQRFKGNGNTLPQQYGPQLPTVTIMGPWSWNVTLPMMNAEDVNEFMAQWNEVISEHVIPAWERELLGASSPNSAD